MLHDRNRTARGWRLAAVRTCGTLLLCASTVSLGTGCAAGAKAPVVSDTKIGQIIIYRNGVAFFERYAPPGDKTLTLRVPAERVDDFLKSLTIIDEKTGEAMPVTYPTMEQDGSEVEMTIELPEGHNQLKISYVTESPAWKPSYRVVLSEDGGARLQGWAIVDNVTSEDWKNVRVGVGSTSALSFRYDLHSVRLVQRETLSSGSLVAAAPPTGGSPYADKNKGVPRVIGNLSGSEVLALQQSHGGEGRASYADAPHKAADPRREPPRPQGPAASPSYGSRAGRGAGAYGVPVTNALGGLSAQLASGARKVRVEGYAQADDKDPRSASLERANAVREQLIAMGVDASQVEAVGTGRVDAGNGVRVLELPDTEPAQPGAHGPGDVPQPIGHAHFVAEEAMTIAGQHSAMVSILNAATRAERVFYYDPVSERGSKRFAFNAVRIDNPSPYTLDSGPFTVYAADQFLGEGLADPILPGTTAFIPYALDRSVTAETEMSAREEIERLLTIQRGVVSTETRRIRRTKLTLENRGKEDATVYVRHKVAPGFTFSDTKLEVEKMGGAYLVKVAVAAGASTEVVLDEHTPIQKTVNIHTDEGVQAIALFLRKRDIEPALQAQLDAIVKQHTALADLVERVEVLGEQMGVYQTRVDELGSQLATLRKVKQAEDLRRHLAARMEEISQRLQDATIRMAELKGQQMTQRIELQDRLADLRLEKDKPAADKVAVAGEPAAR